MRYLKHQVSDELLFNLPANYRNPENLIGGSNLLKQSTKLMVEKALNGGMNGHLGHARLEVLTNPICSGHRGRSRGTVKIGFGEMSSNVPCDHRGKLEPQLTPRHQARRRELATKILSLYVLGLTGPAIQAYLEVRYDADVPLSLISSVTNFAMNEVEAWRARPLDPIYPIVSLDCIQAKVRESAVQVKAVYVAIGVTMAGEKEVLGLWLAQTESAEFWLQIMSDLRNRGVQDILIACVDGLKVLTETLETVFPHTTVQPSIMHMVRHSLSYVTWKQRSEVLADLKRIYTSSTLKEAGRRLAEFETKWDNEYQPIGQLWRRNWLRVIQFFNYPPEIRVVIGTTSNAMESVNMRLRMLAKNRGVFPGNDSLAQAASLALNSISKKWKMPIHHWKVALNVFTAEFKQRLPRS